MKDRSILIIDDSKEILELQRMILEEDGFKVTSANGGMVALEMLSDMEEPNLIILDQNLDDMSGIEFLSILSEQKPKISANVPVVILSGSEPSYTDKAVGFIQKFPDIEVFLERIHFFMDSGTHQRIIH